MFKEYLDCEIKIGPRSNARLPLSIRAPGGEADGELQLPLADTDFQQLLQQLRALYADEELLTAIGRRLFDALFPGKFREIFVRSQGMLRADQGLRLVLNIGADELDVAALPWEFLYNPDQGPLV